MQCVPQISVSKSRPIPLLDQETPGLRWLLCLAGSVGFAVFVGDVTYGFFLLLACALYVLERILTEVRRTRREAQEARDWMD